MLPDGWEHTPLGDIIADLESGISVNASDRPAREGEIGILKVSSVTEGRFQPEENKAVLSKETIRAQVTPKAGDILISRANTYDLVAAAAYISHDYPHLYLPDKLWRVVLKDEKRDCRGWLFQVLRSPDVRTALKARATGTSSSMKNISQEAFLGITVGRPPVKEQRRIGVILGTWDRAIDLLQRVIAGRIETKQGLMQQLLTGKRRLRGSQRAWQEVHLRDVTTEGKERNGGRLGVECVKAVNKVLGLVPMRARVIGESIDRYKVVPSKAFAYNPMRLNIGSLVMSNETRDVLVSPDYVVFTCNDGQLDPDYLNHYRRAHAWTKFVEVAGNGSVRVRIYYKDLGTMKVNLPPFKEQQRIAEVLNTCDREIGLLQQQLEAFKSQKTGLMQKLLTGQIRTTR
jgi:type I restriction enzyme S subunit